MPHASMQADRGAPDFGLSIPPTQVKTGKKNIFGRVFNDEAGASPNWLFVGSTNKTKTKRAIVKVACIPVGKTAAVRYPKCMADLTAAFARTLLGIEKLVEDCGLTGTVAAGVYPPPPMCNKSQPLAGSCRCGAKSVGGAGECSHP